MTSAPTVAPLPLLEVTLVLETQPSEEEQQSILDEFCANFAAANEVAVELVVCTIEFSEARRRLLAVTATLSVAVAPDANPVEAAQIPVASAEVIAEMATKVTESVTAVTGKAPKETPIVTVPTESESESGSESESESEYSGAGVLQPFAAGVFVVSLAALF